MLNFNLCALSSSFSSSKRTNEGTSDCSMLQKLCWLQKLHWPVDADIWPVTEIFPTWRSPAITTIDEKRSLCCFVKPVRYIEKKRQFFLLFCFPICVSKLKMEWMVDTWTAIWMQKPFIRVNIQIVWLCIHPNLNFCF